MARPTTRWRQAKITNALWRYRKRMEFTQQEVATLLGCRSAERLIRWERSHELPTLVNALKLGIAYRVPVEFLFGDLYDQLKASIRAREKRMTFRRHREPPPPQGPESPREFRWPGLALPEKPF